MKRFFTSLMLLAALLCSTSSWAQKLWVAGVSVNMNATTEQTITGTNISGTVTYNPSSKTLYLKNATIKGSITGENLGSSASTRYFIHLTGSNKITSSNYGMRFDDSYMILYGAAGASLYIDTNESTSGYASIDTEGGHFEVWSVRLIMSGKTCGFWGSPSKGTLEFVNSMVSINCTGGAIKFCKGVYYDDCMCTNTGVTHDSGTGYVNSSGTLVSSLEIWPYLTVGNEPVRTTVDSKTGTLYSWKWTKSTKTLEITGDASTASYEGILNYGIDGLTVKSEGTYTITADWSGFETYKNATIAGGGKLILKATKESNSYGIRVNSGSDVLIGIKELEAQGAYGFFGSNGALTVKRYSADSNILFNGTQGNVIRISSLNLDNMDVWTAGTWYNPSAKAMYFKDDVSMYSVGSNTCRFRAKDYSGFTYYPVYVAGVQLNNRNTPSNNSNYPFCAPNVSGSVDYDPSSKTLDLNNTVITAPSGNTKEAVVSEVDGLKINITGTVEFKTIGDCFYLKAPAEFTGNGKLTANSSTGSGLSIYGNTKVTLNVNNELHFEGAEYGYWGHHDNNNRPDCDLILTKAGSNSDYYFKGTKASLYQASHIVCNDMDYYYSSSYGTPGCYYDETNHVVKQNGGTTVKESDVNFYQVSEKYGIFIGDVEITSCNRNGVGSPYLNKPLGVIYSNNTKTLTLDGVTFNYTGSETNTAGIKFNANVSGKINVKGNNTLSGNSGLYSPLWIQKNADVELIGDGTLTLGGGMSAYLYGSALTVGDNVTLLANQDIGSNASDQSNYGKLTIKENALVKAKQIVKLSSLTLEDGQKIVEPTGAQFQDNNVVVSGSTAQNVVIMKVEDYGLAVCDVAVNSYNCNDILGDGKFSYDPESKTLTINGANINNTDIADVVVNNDVDGLKVNFIGDNSFKVKDNIFQLYKSTTISGTGTISGELAASDGYGIWYKEDLDITLDGAIFQFKGQKGVSGFYSEKTVNMTINSGKFIFEPSTSDGVAIEGLASLTLGEGMLFTEPAGASYSTSLKAVTVDGANKYFGKVVIEGATAFDLAIADKTVTTANCNDILSNGVFKYDDASKTLTINGDCSFNDWIVNSSIAGLTINIAGNSTLTETSGSTIIRLYAPTTITGGTLTLVSTATDKDALGIYISAGDLLIKDAEINVSGDGFVYGITGTDECQLTIDNSEISATAHTYGAIYDWNNITLTNCYVDEPRPSQIFNYGIAAANGVVVGAGEASETVVIKAGTDAIQSIEMANAAAADVYDVAGRKLDQTRRGVNIIRTNNGKTVKVLKK